MKIAYAWIEKIIYYKNEKEFDDHLDKLFERDTTFEIVSQGELEGNQQYTYMARIRYEYNNYHIFEEDITHVHS